MREEDKAARALLPSYADGTLAEDQRRAVEAALARSPQLRAEFAAWLAMRDHAPDGPAPSVDLGLSELLARIEAEEAPARGLAPRLRAGWMRPALALAGALALAQAFVIAALVAERSAPRQAAGTLIEARFEPSATEQQIRALLAEAGAEIVAGPSPLAVYTLRVAPGAAQAAAARLRRSTAVVDTVAILPH